MIDKDLLQILACPETHQSLEEAQPELLKRLNDKISAGKAKNKGGADVKEPLTAGLVRQDQTIVYPIRDNIPVLLIDEGIPV